MNHKKWTNEHLKSLKPCADGYEWYVKNCLERGIEDTATIIDLLINDEKLDWANWTIARALSRKNQIRYTIFAAEQVIDIFEKEYPNDDRPRKAIEAARAVLENDTEKNRLAADAAASAAADASAAAAADASAAVYAANVAASAAADASAAAAVYVSAAVYAAHASYATSSATAYAANVAASAAADATTKEKIIRYGVSLLEGKV